MDTEVKVKKSIKTRSQYAVERIHVFSFDVSKKMIKQRCQSYI
jgi:hypothetical protein